MLFSAPAMYMKCSKNLVATSSYTTSLRAKFDSDGEHVQTEHAHPGRAVRLFQAFAVGQGRAAVKHADVVQSEKSRPETRCARPGLCG